MNRQEKIAKLKKVKGRKHPESLGDYVVLADAMEAIVADFKASLKKGVDINDLDVLIDRLEGISELKTAVDELKNAIKSFPTLPEEVKIASVNEFLDAIKSIDIKVPDVNIPAQKVDIPDYTGAVKKLADAVSQMAISVKASSPKPTSQRAADYIPYRRVIKKGNTFEFDDSVQQGGPGGSTTPSRHNTDGEVYVPVANPDGTNIGSGAGGDASAANQQTIITNQNPLDKYRIADEDSLAATKYYGFVSSTNQNKWVVLQQVVGATTTAYRYANLSNNATRTNYGAAGATGAWANRASLSYDYLYNLTGL